jgi:hypothetical protein
MGPTTNQNRNYFIPSHLPSFIRRPPRDNGIPVFFDTRRFALVTPSARFHENDKPGPSFTAPPESPPKLPHLVHTYVYVYVDRLTDQPAHQPKPPRPRSGSLWFFIYSSSPTSSILQYVDRPNVFEISSRNFKLVKNHSVPAVLAKFLR